MKETDVIRECGLNKLEDYFDSLEPNVYVTVDEVSRFLKASSRFSLSDIVHSCGRSNLTDVLLNLGLDSKAEGNHFYFGRKLDKLPSYSLASTDAAEGTPNDLVAEQQPQRQENPAAVQCFQQMTANDGITAAHPLRVHPNPTLDTSGWGNKGFGQNSVSSVQQPKQLYGPPSTGVPIYPGNLTSRLNGEGTHQKQMLPQASKRWEIDHSKEDLYDEDDDEEPQLTAGGPGQNGARGCLQLASAMGGDSSFIPITEGDANTHNRAPPAKTRQFTERDPNGQFTDNDASPEPIRMKQAPAAALSSGSQVPAIHAAGLPQIKPPVGTISSPFKFQQRFQQVAGTGLPMMNGHAITSMPESSSLFTKGGVAAGVNPGSLKPAQQPSVQKFTRQAADFSQQQGFGQPSAPNFSAANAQDSGGAASAIVRQNPAQMGNKSFDGYMSDTCYNKPSPRRINLDAATGTTMQKMNPSGNTMECAARGPRLDTIVDVGNEEEGQVDAGDGCHKPHRQQQTINSSTAGQPKYRERPQAVENGNPALMTPVGQNGVTAKTTLLNAHVHVGQQLPNGHRHKNMVNGTSNVTSPVVSRMNASFEPLSEDQQLKLAEAITALVKLKYPYHVLLNEVLNAVAVVEHRLAKMEGFTYDRFVAAKCPLLRITKGKRGANGCEIYLQWKERPVEMLFENPKGANNSFLIACVQCLRYVPRIYRYLRTHPGPSGDPVIDKLTRLVRASTYSGNSVDSLRKLPELKDYATGQHDAGYFLDEKLLFAHAPEEWKQMFAFQYRSTITCERCSKISHGRTKTDRSLILSVQDETKDFEEALATLENRRHLPEMRCRKEGCKGRQMKQTEYNFNSSKYLLLRFNIFDDQNGLGFRLRPKFTHFDEDCQYIYGHSWRAIATILHKGGETPDSGHYYAMGRWEGESDWLVMDDATPPHKSLTLNLELEDHYVIIFEKLGTKKI